ncbi:MAG: ATP-binding protein [Bacteroidetes bacterium]|nr:MAG: ATP-binding protein [Bacteroidota bacterium]
MERKIDLINKIKNFLKRKIIISHLIISIAVFYFFIHPLTMVIYWFEFSNTTFSYSLLLEVIGRRIQDSFSFHMMGMSTAFIILGGLVGLGSGIYSKKILKKNKTLKDQEAQLGKSIKQLIANGESEKVEFKSSLRYDYRKEEINTSLEKVFLKTIAGFLNTSGGMLIIGLDDQGEILGLNRDYKSLRKKNRDGFELKLMQLISVYLGTENCPLVHIMFYHINGMDICSLEVEPSKTPVYLSLDSALAFFIRAGNSTKQLTIKEAVNYINLKSN